MPIAAKLYWTSNQYFIDVWYFYTRYKTVIYIILFLLYYFNNVNCFLNCFHYFLQKVQIYQYPRVKRTYTIEQFNYFLYIITKTSKHYVQHTLSLIFFARSDRATHLPFSILGVARHNIIAKKLFLWFFKKNVYTYFCRSNKKIYKLKC